MEVLKLIDVYDFSLFMSHHLKESPVNLIPFCREYILRSGYHVFRSSKKDACVLVEPRGTRCCMFHLYTNEGADRDTLRFIDKVREYMRMNTQVIIALNTVKVDDRQKRLAIRMLMKERGGNCIGQIGDEIIFSTNIRSL